METEPATSTEVSALTDSFQSVAWDPEVGCGTSLKGGTVPCDGEFIWPANAGITSTIVLYRKGPDGSTGPTFLAFVVWNQSTVGHILRSTFGRNGTHLRTTISNISAARTFGAPDNNQGSAGNSTVGNPPSPGPHIDDPIQVSQRFLDAAKVAARNINAASLQFTAFSEQ
jgi:hypothetical protein